MSRISLQTIARAARVSKTTASLVLNGHAARYHIASDTEKRVKDIARELNYHPHKLILNPFNGKSHILGVLVYGKPNHLSRSILEHLIVEARDHRYHIIPEIISSIENEDPSPVHRFLQMGVDGLILLNGIGAVPEATIPETIHIPIIRVGDVPAAENRCAVQDDYAAGINLLIEHLYRRNKKAIGYLGYNSREGGDAEIKDTWLENYCNRFEIEPNLQLVSLSFRPSDEREKPWLTLIEHGANGILFGSAELAVMAFSDDEFREAVEQNHILCAAYGYHPAFQLLSHNLIYALPGSGDTARAALALMRELMDNPKSHATRWKVEPRLYPAGEPKT